MGMVDPIADMMTRIRNAIIARHETVDIPYSNMKFSISKILKEEGYIRDFEVIKDLTRALQYSPCFDDMDKRSLLARIVKSYPAVQVLISGERAELIRPRERMQDLMAGEAAE